jgi:hypothetical protein
MERVLCDVGKEDTEKNMYGPTYENGQRRMKINQEMYNKYKSPDIVTVIKVRTLEWRGHVRMDDATAVKKLVEGNPGGMRKKGRPRLKWIDDAELDYRNMDVKRQKKRGVDRRK